MVSMIYNPAHADINSHSTCHLMTYQSVYFTNFQGGLELFTGLGLTLGPLLGGVLYEVCKYLPVN